MRHQHKRLLLDGIAALIGQHPKRIDTHGDPNKVGSYAVRATMPGDAHRFFAIDGFDRCINFVQVKDALNEWKFTTWPPSSSVWPVK